MGEIFFQTKWCHFFFLDSMRGVFKYSTQNFQVFSLLLSSIPKAYTLFALAVDINNIWFCWTYGSPFIVALIHDVHHSGRMCNSFRTKNNNNNECNLITHSVATSDSPQGMAKNGNDAEIDEGLYSRQL